MLATTRTAHGPNLLARLLDVKTSHQIDECAKCAWILNGEGMISDNEMAYLAPIIEHQRKAIRSNGSLRRSHCHDSAKLPRIDHRRPAIPPDKKMSCWARRRALAKECVIPTSIATKFTISKLAVLAVIARAVVDRGSCNMSLPEIAARAGVGCTTARYAIRDAARMGLITVIENRVNSTWNRPNTIRIVCDRWRKWLNGHRRMKARAGSNSLVVSGGLPTPLTNLIPSIEIDKFTLCATVQRGSGNYAGALQGSLSPQRTPERTHPLSRRCCVGSPFGLLKECGNPG
ncbi:hypothetical protein OE766_25000 [Pararhizobium sp. YC-54]|uniref:hypothetical protein n=1 Tax=Pararhizobium sp. YC-54 TaxID=2986920 RepID=UPI0021F7D9CA|nr:hypothetical protein [Pararhizobium sp. YC-54]MCW0001484.1 hypothetical protein [Pararhizobium sp. YC-54]